jgi:adenosine deaminase
VEILVEDLTSGIEAKTGVSIDFWRSMPKPDMHFHLFGAARPSTVLELAEKNGRILRDTTVSLLQKNRFFDKDFQDFIDTYREIRDCFVTKNDFERLVWETLEDAALDGVRYVSVRVNWQYRMGESLSHEMMEAIDSGRNSAERAFGIKTRCFIDFPGWEERSYASGCVKFAMAHRHLGIVGVDMVGSHSPIHEEDIRSLRQAKTAGLQVVAHAGEVKGAEEMWGVLHNFPVSRITHGLAAVQDVELLKHLANANIAIEVCPVSNLCTQRIQRIENHPARSFIDYAVPIVVASDDPTLFRTTLSEQYSVLETKANLSTNQLIEACRRGFEIACLDSSDKEELLTTFEGWYAETFSSAMAPRSTIEVQGQSVNKRG